MISTWLFAFIHSAILQRSFEKAVKIEANLLLGETYIFKATVVTYTAVITYDVLSLLGYCFSELLAVFCLIQDFLNKNVAYTN